MRKNKHKTLDCKGVVLGIQSSLSKLSWLS